MFNLWSHVHYNTSIYIRIIYCQFNLWLFLLISRVQHQISGIGHVLTDQHRSVGTVQFGHLDGLQHVVGPVQVSADPVHSETLRHSDAAVKDLKGEKNDWEDDGKTKWSWDILETYHSAVTSILVSAPYFVLSGVWPVNTIRNGVKIQSNDITTISNQRANDVWLGGDVVWYDLAPTGH